MVLVLHEAVDLAPTPLHSLGGVVGPIGPNELTVANTSRRILENSMRSRTLRRIDPRGMSRDRILAPESSRDVLRGSPRAAAHAFVPFMNAVAVESPLR